MESVCVLCCEPLLYVCMGRCNHKNMCEKCGLRLRLLMKNFHCPMCKTELEEVIITENLEADFKTMIKDRTLLMPDLACEGDAIFYDTYKTKYACTRLRELTCLYEKCHHSKTRFPNIQAL